MGIFKSNNENPVDRIRMRCPTADKLQNFITTLSSNNRRTKRAVNGKPHLLAVVETPGHRIQYNQYLSVERGTFFFQR